MPKNRKKLSNYGVTVISIVAGALGTVPKSLEKELEEEEISENRNHPYHSIAEIG